VDELAWCDVAMGEEGPEAEEGSRNCGIKARGGKGNTGGPARTVSLGLRSPWTMGEYSRWCTRSTKGVWSLSDLLI
jgi:hypothetical protein